jgi:hypothetical protein
MWQVDLSVIFQFYFLGGVPATQSDGAKWNVWAAVHRPNYDRADIPTKCVIETRTKCQNTSLHYILVNRLI